MSATERLIASDPCHLKRSYQWGGAGAMTLQEIDLAGVSSAIDTHSTSNSAILVAVHSSSKSAIKETISSGKEAFVPELSFTFQTPLAADSFAKLFADAIFDCQGIQASLPRDPSITSQPDTVATRTSSVHLKGLSISGQ